LSALFALTSIVVATGAAALSFKFVERPGINLGRRWTGAHQKPSNFLDS
jgi:peptidoglycan/LPS O-acetylase OafA/YrhL